MSFGIASASSHSPPGQPACAPLLLGDFRGKVQRTARTLRAMAPWPQPPSVSLCDLGSVFPRLPSDDPSGLSRPDNTAKSRVNHDQSSQRRPVAAQGAGSTLIVSREGSTIELKAVPRQATGRSGSTTQSTCSQDKTQCRVE